jgi:hypothetical protein
MFSGDHAMTTRMRRIPDLEALFQAADAHAADAGDADHAFGDLQAILRVAWRLLTPAQRQTLFAEPELEELAELPEYAPLIGHLTRRQGHPPREGEPGDADVD